MPKRKHEGTLANSLPGGETLILVVIGGRPDSLPYLSIQRTGPEPRDVLATVDNANALRGLARRILRALGDEGGDR